MDSWSRHPQTSRLEVRVEYVLHSRGLSLTYLPHADELVQSLFLLIFNRRRELYAVLCANHPEDYWPRSTIPSYRFSHVELPTARRGWAIGLDILGSYN
jgi:hypothetical protein